MAGTYSFTHLPDSQKKCYDHSFVDCQAKKFLSQVQSQCDCTPWALRVNTTEQTCNRDKDKCIAKLSSKDEKCLVPCTGIYADITEELFLQKLRKEYSNSSHVKNEENEQELLNLEYIRYKQTYVKQIWFDANEYVNLSKSSWCFHICKTFLLQLFFYSTNDSKSYSTGGCLHLLWHRDL